MTHKHSRFDFFDPGDEETFLLSQAPKSISLSYWSLRDYAHQGKLSIRGALVRLEVCQLPQGLGTTLQAYRRFIARLNGKETA